MDGRTHTLGVIDSTIQINGNSFRIPVHVLDKLAHDMLLGLDVAHSAGLVIDFGKQINARTLALHFIDIKLHQSNHLIHNQKQISTAVIKQTTLHSKTIRNKRQIKSLKPDSNPVRTPRNPKRSHLNSSINSIINSVLQHEVRALKLRKSIIVDGLIHVQLRGYPRMVIPQSLISSVLEEFLDKRNHPGFRKTTRLITQRFWWPNLFSEVKLHIRSTHVCKSYFVALTDSFNQSFTNTQPDPLQMSFLPPEHLSKSTQGE